MYKENNMLTGLNHVYMYMYIQYYKLRLFFRLLLILFLLHH